MIVDSVDFNKMGDSVDFNNMGDSDLIRMSTKGILPTKGKQIGKGLYYCKQTILDYGGELRIRSGRACVDFTYDGREEPKDQLIRSSGTTLRIIFPRKDNL